MTDEPTRNDNILDLVMTTNQDLVNDLQIEPGMSDHEIVIANINIGAQRQRRPERTVYQYKKGNMDDMRMDMKEFSDKFCEQNHRTKDTETISNEFKDALVKSADQHIPRKKITSRWNLPWMTPSVRRLCRLKKRKWTKAKKTKKTEDWKNYKTTEKNVKQEIEKAHREYRQIS
jgi:hypothetical protein